ncbi:MAG: metallophosphoesterase family protein [Tardiphaga sp.]|jgi:serine/threonine protein phosphatase 1|nr:metallophosphoesterase family protein [Xanthobacteraceae bacterium]
MRTYALSDIHGCLDKLVALVERCRVNGGHSAKFVFLGDYIDRGPDSRGVLEFVIDLQRRMPSQVVCLCGNHEDLALNAIDDASQIDQWVVHNGGDKALRSYGATHPSEVPADHVAWLRALVTHHDDGRRFFVHAGINPARPLDRQNRHDLLWMREPFLSDPRDYGRFIVHGHTPIKGGQPDLRVNRVNVDTAAVLGGPLTAAVFDEVQTAPIGFLQEA